MLVHIGQYIYLNKLFKTYFKDNRINYEIAYNDVIKSY